MAPIAVHRRWKLAIMGLIGRATSVGSTEAAPVTLWGFILSGTPLVQEAAAQGYMTEARAMSLQPRR